jgi:hypothetical protein
VVVDPIELKKEMELLRDRGVDISSIQVSPRCHLIMPWHKLLDAFNESTAAKGKKIGTTLRGIGPSYTHKIARTGIRGGALGKIVCRADKTFIDAASGDADKILRAFKNDPDFRFKLDDGRPPKREGRKKEASQENEIKPQTEKKKKQSSKSERKPKTNSKPERKPLREQFWSLIGDTE